MKIVLWTIVAIALAVSGYSTYEVLTGTVGILNYIALAAAVVVDAAAIWMGHHTTTLAKLGDNTKFAQAATWIIILISVAVNFFHGYIQGGIAGGLVNIIFPFLAALLFEFFIRHTIREELRARGRILPEKPIYLTSRKYGDKARHVALQRDYVSLTQDIAEAKMRQLRDSLDTRETSTETAIQHSDTRRDTDIDVALQDETARHDSDTRETDVAIQVETALVGIETPEDLVSLPDFLSPGMNTAEVCRLLVENDMRDIDTAVRYTNILNEDSVSRATVRQSLNRAIKRYSETRNETHA